MRLKFIGSGAATIHKGTPGEFSVGRGDIVELNDATVGALDNRADWLDVNEEMAASEPTPDEPAAAAPVATEEPEAESAKSSGGKK